MDTDYILQAARDMAAQAQRSINQRPQSYFPAARQFVGNNSGMQFVGNNPGVQAMNRPMNQGGTPATGMPRLGRGNLTTYQTPSGGFVTVKSGSAMPATKYQLPSGEMKGYQLTQVGNQLPVDYSGQFNKGQGELSPQLVNTAGGDYLLHGGVLNPSENLTPQQRMQYGAAGSPAQRATDMFRSNPALSAYWNFGSKNLASVGSALGRFGTLGYNALASLGRMFNSTPQSNPNALNTSYNPPRDYLGF